MRRIGLFISLAAGLAVASDGSAQTPTVPDMLGDRCALAPLQRPEPKPPHKLVDTKPTDALTRSYQSGEWTDFERDVLELRDQMNANSGCMKAAGGKVTIAATDYLLIAWVGDTGLGDTALLTAVVHEGAGEGYVSRLPGLSAQSSSKLYQIFISDDPLDVMASVYMSTREQNPLLKQIPEVAEKILDPMLGLLSATLGTEPLPPNLIRTATGGWATPSVVKLPYERAAVKVAMKAQLTSSGRFAKASERLRNTLTLIDVRYSEPAKELACQFHAVLEQNASACAADTSPAACLARVDPEFRKKYSDACGGNCSGDLEKALQTVDGKFRALAAAGVSEKLDAKAELRNVPLTRYSFGLMTGFSFWRKSSAPRVEVDDGVLQHDPLDRTITMVTFNGAFTAYDADAFSITKAERHRWFVGAVITPSFGAGVGYTWLPTRGLGINVGYAALGISVADGGKQIGEKPADSADPFKLGVTGTAFVGASYNFK